MSLIAWCPFTENKLDRIQQIEFSGNYTLNNFGKIGKCAWVNGNSLSAQYNSGLKNASIFSIAFWIYYSDTLSMSAWADLFGLTVTNSNGTTSLRAEITSTGGQGAGVFCNTVLTGSGGACGFTLTKNTWHHLVMTKNHTSFTMYLDGNLINSYNFINAGYPNALATGEIHLGDSTFAGGFNDFRIYDHELSALEIKYLSQALVMHYDFNDFSLEETTNYSLPSQWGYYTDYYTPIKTTDNGLVFRKTSLSSSETVAIHNSTIYNQMAVGDTWTASCYLYKNSKPFKATDTIFTNWGLGQTVLRSESRNDGYFTYTFTITEKKNSYLIHAPFFGALSTISLDDIFEIRYLQFEKKDHPTAYVVGNRSQSILNEAGTYHCVDSKNVNLTQDAISGEYALKCNQTWIKTMTNTSGHTDLTLAAWVKPSTFTNGADNSCIIIGGAYLTLNPSGKIYTYCYGKNKQGYHTGATSLPLNEWSHIAAVWDEKAQEHRMYLNGKLDATITGCYGEASSNHEKKCIGYENGTGRPYTGLIDDVRIYTTALSEADIFELYASRTYLTQEGVVGTHEFIETTDNLFNEDDFKAKAKQTHGNGTLELRNGYLAYGLSAAAFWYGNSVASNIIFQEKIKPNTQYYIDCWIDADTMWYDGGGRYVPGGLTLLYTDGTEEQIHATSVGGNSGWQHVTFYTNAAKSVQGLGVYYYIGNKFYLRADSYMVEVTKNATTGEKEGIYITENYVAQAQQLNETSYNGNILYHDAGSISASEIIEI